MSGVQKVMRINALDQEKFTIYISIKCTFFTNTYECLSILTHDHQLLWIWTHYHLCITPQ